MCIFVYLVLVLETVLKGCVRAQSYLTLCNPLDWSPPGSSVHGILQARILEWVAISCSGGSSRPRNGTHVSCVSYSDRIPYQLCHLESPVLKGSSSIFCIIIKSVVIFLRNTPIFLVTYWIEQQKETEKLNPQCVCMQFLFVLCLHLQA